MCVGFVVGFVIGSISGKRSDAGSLPLFAMKSILCGRGGAEVEGLSGVCRPFNYVGHKGKVTVVSYPLVLAAAD